MDSNRFHSSAELLIEFATDGDMRQAAAAILDAAVLKHQQKSELTLSEGMREALIDAIVRDPLMTAHVLDGTAFCLH